MVVGVPISALTAAQGYAEASGLPYRDGLIHNRYIHRTFIQPELRQRQTTADLKYNAIPEIVGNKRVVVVDDSLVRGNSQEKFIKLLRSAGARRGTLADSLPAAAPSLRARRGHGHAWRVDSPSDYRGCVGGAQRQQAQ